MTRILINPKSKGCRIVESLLLGTGAVIPTDAQGVSEDVISGDLPKGVSLPADIAGPMQLPSPPAPGAEGGAGDEGAPPDMPAFDIQKLLQMLSTANQGRPRVKAFFDSRADMAKKILGEREDVEPSMTKVETINPNLDMRVVVMPTSKYEESASMGCLKSGQTFAVVQFKVNRTEPVDHALLGFNEFNYTNNTPEDVLTVVIWADEGEDMASVLTPKLHETPPASKGPFVIGLGIGSVIRSKRFNPNIIRDLVQDSISERRYILGMQGLPVINEEDRKSGLLAVKDLSNEKGLSRLQEMLSKSQHIDITLFASQTPSRDRLEAFEAALMYNFGLPEQDTKFVAPTVKMGAINGRTCAIPIDDIDRQKRMAKYRMVINAAQRRSMIAMRMESMLGQETSDDTQQITADDVPSPDLTDAEIEDLEARFANDVVERYMCPQVYILDFEKLTPRDRAFIKFLTAMSAGMKGPQMPVSTVIFPLGRYICLRINPSEPSAVGDGSSPRETLKSFQLPDEELKELWASFKHVAPVQQCNPIYYMEAMNSYQRCGLSPELALKAMKEETDYVESTPSSELASAFRQWLDDLAEEKLPAEAGAVLFSQSVLAQAEVMPDMGSFQM
ncbi:MAG: uncharacterized protein KVP18_002520 [Porospora cf. gigantea A]|uniref:uncharacterized protein n=1 Tax=Porospora cf. gigantea A TaxID=2853593 RepID=UPI00355A260F|nr:MAG: hypothetical protein KVP18_002520 [Porospora cf. gigantea A]